MFANKLSFVFLAIGATFSLLLVYIPFMNIAFQTNYRLSPIVWLIGIAFGVFLYGYSFVRTAVKKFCKFFWILKLIQIN